MADPSPGLYSFDASSQALKQLVAGPHEREDVWWSPDGQWIASEDTGDGLVDVIHSDGGDLRDVVSVSWSRSGSEVAYTTKKGLFVGPADWSRARRVSPSRRADALDWSGDSSRFIFGPRSGCCWGSLSVARANGTGVRRLWKPPGHGSWIDDASWSPTGSNIAIDATINDIGVARRKGGEFLYLANPARKGARKIRYTVNADFKEWSPDGKSLILRSENSLYKLSAKGGKARSLCPQSCPEPVFSPDGRRFAFVTGSGSQRALWVGNADGSGQQRIAGLSKPARIAWSPDGRKLGLTLEKEDDPHPSIAVADLATNEITPLTDGSRAEYLAALSRDGSLAAFYRADPPSLWVVSTNGGTPKMVTTLVSDPDLGSCAIVAWSPTSLVLAIANEACAPD